MSDSIAAALATPIEYENGKGTLRSYLKDLLQTLWIEEEGFSGKRPFGNSGWQHEVYAALIKAGCIDGELDDDGYTLSMDDDAGEQLVLAVIMEVFAPPEMPVGTVLRREVAQGPGKSWEVAVNTAAGWVWSNHHEFLHNGGEQPYDDEDGAWEVIHG